MKVKLSEELISILDMIYQGKTNKEISVKLNYSKRTVDNKVNKLFRIYKVKNRMQLLKEYLLEKFAI